jgi:hypothetical protein
MIKTLSMALMILMLSAVSQAAFELVDNFDTGTDTAAAIPFDGATYYTIPPYTINARTGPAPVSAIWDSASDESNNVQMELASGTTDRYGRLASNSTGIPRGVGFNQTYKTIGAIGTGGLGEMFFRYRVNLDTKIVKTYMGIHSLTSTAGTAPFVEDQVLNAPNYIQAGFLLTGTGVDTFCDIKTTNGLTILKAGIERTASSYYDVWIVANHVTDSFDLYMREATEGRSVPPPSKTPADLIASNIPFGNGSGLPAHAPLVGGMWTCGNGTGTDQPTTTKFDDVYWDGDATTTKAGYNVSSPIVPAYNQLNVPRNQDFSWGAPTDPNVEQLIGYNVYVDSSPTKVAAADSGCEWKSLAQAGTTFTTPVLAAGNTQYFWRVDSIIEMDNDPNHVHATIAGDIWKFTTRGVSITAQPADSVVKAAEQAQFTVAATSPEGLPLSYQWHSSLDQSNNTPANDVHVGTNSATYTIPTVALTDEKYYYCTVTDTVSSVSSNAVSLGVKRQLARWTLNQSDYNATTRQYNDVAAGNLYPATIADVNDTAAFVTGIVTPTAAGAVAFDPNSAGIVGPLNPSEMTKQLSVGAWVKWDGTQDITGVGGTVIQKGDVYATSMWYFRVRSPYVNNLASVRFYNTFGCVLGSGSNTDPNLCIGANVWSHLFVTYDGAIAKLYINGKLVGTDTSAGTLGVGSGADTAASLRFGVGSTELLGKFPGAIDDIQIYNYALSDAGVAYAYTDVVGGTICLDSQIPNDYDRNCRVDIGDLAFIAANWLYDQILP